VVRVRQAQAAVTARAKRKRAVRRQSEKRAAERGGGNRPETGSTRYAWLQRRVDGIKQAVRKGAEQAGNAAATMVSSLRSTGAGRKAGAYNRQRRRRQRRVFKPVKRRNRGGNVTRGNA